MDSRDLLNRLYDLNARIGEGADFAQKVKVTNEFSLLGGLVAGGAIHVGSNALVKGMLKPRTLAQRIGSAVFQKGVRDQGAGRMIHPAVQRASDALLGPEWSHLYKSGLHSNRAVRKGIAAFPEKAGGELGNGIKGIVSGRRNSLTEKALGHLPHVPISRGTLKRDWLGAAAAGAGAAAMDPVLPAMNLTRTAIANSKMGKRVLKKAMIHGAEHGAQTGVGRALKDYVVSPSLNLARDAGSTGAGVYRKSPRRIKGRVLTSA